MAQRVSKSKMKAFFIDENCHPQNIAVMQTRAAPLGIEIIGAPEDLDATQVFGAIFQYPGTYGHVRDFTDPIAALHLAQGDRDCLCRSAVSDLAQRTRCHAGRYCGWQHPALWRAGGYGGPHAAYMATKDAYKRSMPGRIVGVSVDANGNRAYRLSLQTREQHIRREKATSTVCTAQALLAVMASFYAVFHGPEGLKAIAQRIHRKTVRLAKGFEAAGFKVEPKAFLTRSPLRSVRCKTAVMASQWLRGSICGQWANQGRHHSGRAQSARHTASGLARVWHCAR